MSLFSSRKNKKEVVLILDIGSGSVAGSFVEFSADQNPKILYVKRVPIKFSLLLSGTRFKKKMLGALLLLMENLNNEGLGYVKGYSKNHIKKVYCSLASPWFVSQTKSVRIKKNKPFVITEQFISDFLKKEEEDFEDSNLSKYESNTKQRSEIIERKLVGIKLNGYNTKNPLGKKASEARLSLFLSMSQKSILDSIEDIVSKHFYIENINFHSFTLASFSAIRDMYEAVPSFLLLDITGEVTDVSLIKSGNILRTMSYPVGKNSLIREITKKLKTTPEEATSSLRLLLTDTLSAQKKKTLTSILESPKNVWSKEFQKAIVNIAEGTSVPTTVFFTADDDVASWYGRLINSEEFVQLSMTDSPFIVSFINPLSLDSHVSFRTKAEKDTFIAVESIFFNRLLELGE